MERMASFAWTGNRPWQKLLNVRVVSRPVETGEVEERILSLIEQLLPDDLLLYIFSWLPIQSQAFCRCVCKSWNRIGEERVLWKSACQRIFREEPASSLTEEYVMKKYPPALTCWRNMFLDRPRVRHDGVYVSRNTYIRTGIPEWKVKNPVHLVCYYRYIRFLPNGMYVYRTSPMVLKQVIKSLLVDGCVPHGDKDKVYLGRYKLLKNNTVYTAFMYPNSFCTEVRSRLFLRGTCRGSWNRLDISSIVSYDRERGISTNMLNHPLENDEGIPGDKREYERGVEPYCFVSFEEAYSHIINHPVEKLDFFVPG